MTLISIRRPALDGGAVTGAVPARLTLAGLARLTIARAGRRAEEAARRSAARGHPISCRRGCGACCRQPVPLSPPEAFHLAEVVGGAAPEAREAVLARFEAARAALAEGGLRDEPLLDRGRDYFALGVPCPFLAEEACSIHPDRPAVCREYLVTTPAPWCGEPDVRAPVILPVTSSATDVLADLAAELLGGPPTFVPLVRALDWARENAADGRREWPGPALWDRFRERYHRGARA
jgi:Fe-S-cluster containining protein